MSDTKTIQKTPAVNTPATKSASPAPKKPAESKAQRFQRLAVKRTNAALKYIGYVGNLASTASYAYTPEQSGKITAALADAVSKVAQRFAGAAQPDNRFTL